MHTKKNAPQGRIPIRGPGKWLGFKLIYEHRASPELDGGLPTRLVALPFFSPFTFISCLSPDIAALPFISCVSDAVNSGGISLN